MTTPADVPVFILCGGFGTRIKEETEFRPKPMVPVGGSPILLHIMRWYAKQGFRRFVLCLGYKAQMIVDHFQQHPVEGWQVDLADTGLNTMTGARVARAAAMYLGNAQTFAVTYGDGLTNADLATELAFHLEHGKVGTVLGVNPPSRFGELRIEGDDVLAFDEKPAFNDRWINAGYFFFQRRFLDYLSDDESCVLERKPLVQLASDRELTAWRHRGFWACMDTQRDREQLEELWAADRAPWRV